MRKVIVNEFMSLDAVVQAPGGADEDTSGGFEHGGSHLRYFEDISQRWVVENIADAGGFLRAPHVRDLRGLLPNAPDEEQVLAEPPNTLPKYVAPTTLAEPLP